MSDVWAGNMVDLDSDPTKLIEIVEIGKQLLITRSSSRSSVRTAPGAGGADPRQCTGAPCRPCRSRDQSGVRGARGISVEQVDRLVQKYSKGRDLGLLGEPRVSVLQLNLALDRQYPKS
jgi:hypothetical protein